MFRRISAFLLASALLCTVPAAAAVGSRYSDVPPADWSVSAIEKATDYGLMQGLDGDTFGYGYQMNRASFVEILCNLFSWPKVTPAAPSFSDVASHWAYAAIETALAQGALESGGAFRPDDSITREEMAVMLVRALDYDQLARSLKDTPLPFPDVTSNRGYLALAWRFGIINGGVGEDGTALFSPHQAANREVAAAMVVRAYERYTADIDWLHGFYAFGSYEQINLTAQMDGVSVGWARLDVGADGVPFLNQSTQNGNEWNLPQGAELAVDTFQANGTPYHLSVFSSTGDNLTLTDGTKTNDLHAILATEQSRAQGVAALVSAVAPYGGLTIDFEGLREDKKDAFTAFMTALRASLPTEKKLWVAVQTNDWYKGFDYHALGELCDKVILMAHDYKIRTTPVVGSTNTNNPVTPFSSVYQALCAITDQATGVADRSKIALALSIDSAGYQLDANGSIATPTLYSPGMKTLAQRLRQADTVRGWSDVYRNPYITYNGDDGNPYRVWYEDARSVLAKVELAALFGVRGVSLWRLGNLPCDPDPTLDYDVWSALLTRR